MDTWFLMGSLQGQSFTNGLVTITNNHFIHTFSPSTIHGKGNFSANLEFNFAIDPHAAKIVFSNFGKKIHLTPWEASHEYKITEEEMSVLFDESYPKTKFYKEINAMNVGRYGHIDFCDGLAAVLAVDKTITNTVYELEAKILTEGEAAG
jgi:inosine-uridine nucleoside N-ribohydrolase